MEINLDKLIPEDYFKLDEEQKRNLCVELLDNIIYLVDTNFSPEFNRIEITKILLGITLKQHETEENFEICEVIRDILKIIDED